MLFSNKPFCNVLSNFFLFTFTFILALDILAKISIAQPCRYVWRWILELSIATYKVKEE